ncbi:beta-ketoacyl-[acyl-carrier-protein] synthase family protein [Candidatus Magnetominusculus dajiuhuensis]|uniref:beta-ketoacyl-[acyl-carrier-protein] synthase family protein n=1 Tax=Candidatus Magnetominusculus dajiuhuensis TaxID=3137712 RepID=UPI003B42D067
MVTGMGIITSHGVGVEANWEKIKAGESSVGEITTFDASPYRGRLGAEIRGGTSTPVSRLRAGRLDRASHLLICAVREALGVAGLTRPGIDVFLSLGTTLGGMLSGEAFHREVIEKGISRARISKTLDYLAHYQAVNLFKEFALTGDYTVFSDACASSANAIGHAFGLIASGRYDVAIAGGYDTMTEFTFAGFNSLMAVTPEICRPFDKNRTGLVLGEGVGILVIEELGHAMRRNARVYCEITGYGAASDAYHMTSPDPDGKGAANAMAMALKEAAFPDIGYINAHGTATKYNDLMEARAITKVFSSGNNSGVDIPVSSIKPMIGHLLGAAGAVEAILSIMALVEDWLPPNINYVTPDPDCNLNIVTVGREAKIRAVLSNSFGFGGSNAALIFGEYR